MSPLSVPVATVVVPASEGDGVGSASVSVSGAVGTDSGSGSGPVDLPDLVLGSVSPGGSQTSYIDLPPLLLPDPPDLPLLLPLPEDPGGLSYPPDSPLLLPLPEPDLPDLPLPMLMSLLPDLDQLISHSFQHFSA